MGTTVGPDYFGSVTETSTGYGWETPLTPALEEAGYVETVDLLNDTQTKELSFYNWDSRASVPANAIIDEITFRFVVSKTAVPPVYVPRLYPPGDSFTGLVISTTPRIYTAYASVMGMTNAERLRAVHATSTADSTDFEASIDDWGLVFSQVRFYWITMEVEWSPAPASGGILLAK